MAEILSIVQKQFDADAGEHLAAIIDSSFDAIVSKDLNSIIRSWNKAAERLFGYSAEEAVGQSILMLLPENLQSEEAEIIRRIRAGELVASFETVRRRKDGSLVNVSLTISPVRNRAGEIVGASKIARDVTAAKESERRIRLLMREVNHRTKNQFAVILAMIRETNRRSATPDEFEERVRERILALSRSHDLLVEGEWRGTTMFELAHEHLKPFGHEARVELSGPLLTLSPTSVQHLGIALHELATNAAKHGALSRDLGQVSISWRISDPIEEPSQFELEWDETAPQAAVSVGVAERSGFGSIVLRRIVPQAVNGKASYERSRGRTRWRLTAPVADVVVQPGTDVESAGS